MATNSAHTVRPLLCTKPETVHPNEPVACFGPEASGFVNDQSLGETVWLEADTAGAGCPHRPHHDAEPGR